MPCPTILNARLCSGPTCNARFAKPRYELGNPQRGFIVEAHRWRNDHWGLHPHYCDLGAGYCLADLERHGPDGLSWKNDEHALTTPVSSQARGRPFSPSSKKGGEWAGEASR